LKKSWRIWKNEYLLSCIFLTVNCKLWNFVNGVNKMNISIIGTGYVGLVTGTCLADFFIAVGAPRQVSPSLRATEGRAAIPPSVIAREWNDRSNLNLHQNLLILTSSPTPNSFVKAKAVYDFTHPDKIEYFDPLVKKMLSTNSLGCCIF